MDGDRLDEDADEENTKRIEGFHSLSRFEAMQGFEVFSLLTAPKWTKHKQIRSKSNVGIDPGKRASKLKNKTKSVIRVFLVQQLSS